jgi:hypothetical protein
MTRRMKQTIWNHRLIVFIMDDSIYSRHCSEDNETTQMKILHKTICHREALAILRRVKRNRRRNTFILEFIK